MLADQACGNQEKSLLDIPIPAHAMVKEVLQVPRDDRLLVAAAAAASLKPGRIGKVMLRTGSG